MYSNCLMPYISLWNRPMHSAFCYLSVIFLLSFFLFLMMIVIVVFVVAAEFELVIL